MEHEELDGLHVPIQARIVQGRVAIFIRCADVLLALLK